MNSDLRKIITNSTYSIHKGKFVYVKVKSAPTIDKHFLITKDKDEITVVTLKENVSNLDLIEKNKDFYCLIELKVSIPFYSVGFLAKVSSAIAKKGMNILIVSTYSKDYILVRIDQKDNAEKTLLELGFKKE